MTQFEVVLIDKTDDWRIFGWLDGDQDFDNPSPFSQVRTIPFGLFVIKMEAQFYQVPSLLNCIVKKLRKLRCDRILSDPKTDSK